MIPPFTNNGAMPMDLSGVSSAAKSSNSIGGASQGAINMGVRRQPCLGFC